MKKINTRRPKFVVKNSSPKDVRVLNGATIGRDTTADLFKVIHKLSEAVVIDALREPDGSLYRELYVARTLDLVEFDLVSFSNSSLDLLAAGQNEQILVSTKTGFEWRDPPKTVATNSTTNALSPLQTQGDSIILPKADQNTSGYLSKEDWKMFSGRANQARVWEYQDFAGPIGTSIKLTRFENGRRVFDPTKIVDDSAVITSQEQPEHFLYFGGALSKLFKRERLVVSGHVGEQLTLNHEITVNCRVWFLTTIDAGADLSGFIAAPKIVRDARIELVGQADIDGAGPRKILGDKTFVGVLSTEAAVGIKTNTPTADLDVAGSLKALQFQLPEEAQQNYVLTSNNIGQASWRPSPFCGTVPPSHPYDGQTWVKLPDYEMFVYNSVAKYWIGSTTFQLIGARNSTSLQSGYLNGPDNVPSTHASLVLPYDVILISCSLSSHNKSSWSAEIHIDGKETLGATTSCMDGRGFSNNQAVILKAGQQLSIYVRGAEISFPFVSAIFRRVYS